MKDGAKTTLGMVTAGALPGGVSSMQRSTEKLLLMAGRFATGSPGGVPGLQRYAC